MADFRKAKIRKLGRLGNEEGTTVEILIPREGCAAVAAHATIGALPLPAAMLDFSGLASFHNGTADLEKGQTIIEIGIV